MKIGKNISFTDKKIIEFSLNIIEKREVIPNLIYTASGRGDSGDYILNKVTGKILLQFDHISFDIIEGSGVKFIHINDSDNIYLYEIDLNTGNIYRSSYLYIRQEGEEPILLYNENIQTYKNIVRYFREAKRDLVKDLFVKLDDTYVNFLTITDDMFINKTNNVEEEKEEGTDSRRVQDWEEV